MRKNDLNPVEKQVVWPFFRIFHWSCYMAMESLALVQVSVEIIMFFTGILTRKIDLQSFFNGEKIYY